MSLVNKVRNLTTKGKWRKVFSIIKILNFLRVFFVIRIKKQRMKRDGKN
jgi:hypothetical protein